jgi:hypothetical protein
MDSNQPLIQMTNNALPAIKQRVFWISVLAICSLLLISYCQLAEIKRLLRTRKII